MNASSLQLFHDGTNSLLYYHEDPASKTPCVLKVMKEGLGVPSRVAAFYNEFEIAKDLEIDGVPRYFRKEQLEGRPAIVLSYTEGKPLGLAFKDSRPNITQFLRIAYQSAGILAKIHQSQIIHKDINANNILFHEEEEKVFIIDFGISSKFDIRKQQLSSPDVLEGTLAYISPEQTGRMNRVVDYRTDLYSLGVTFYELLTGRLPFSSKDSMELVHCHLARRPLPPCEVDASIPEVLSDIVMKLLEKSASDRYQSALGLQADLDHCQLEWFSEGKIDAFTLGEKDYSEKLQISQSLYGCDEQQQLLLDSFNRVAEGAVELVLVRGYAGVGKSSLVNEVHGPITERKGYFIRGKHDQYQRAMPYAALIQAINDLVEQILTESQEQISTWKEKILMGISENGAVLIDVIPNLEYIIGAQPEVDKLSPTEAANRFNYVLRKFIEVLSQENHPLVIFLDDLQWADSATLNSLRLLMSDNQNKYLMIIGAYRSNEVDDTHSLTFAIDDLVRAGATVNEVEMNNLSLKSVEKLLADSLYDEIGRIKPLAALVHGKTQGNAFFVNQFLQSLYEESLLSFDVETLKWNWDLEGIQSQNITSNVVTLMAGKIEKLSSDTQRVLQLAACIGDRFALKTLASICQQTIPLAFKALWKAVEEGLVFPLDDNYKIIPALEATDEVDIDASFQFLHDRVQQAAYQLLDDEKRNRVHYEIANTLLKSLPEEEQQDRVFDIVGHANLGSSHAQSMEERLAFSRFNRKAAEKAKDSTAYEAAYNYLHEAVSLLGEEGWQQSYEDSLLTRIDLAETAYLIGKRDEMEEHISVILQYAVEPLDKVKAFEIRSHAQIANGEMKGAIKTALQVLKLLKIKFPKRPNKIHIVQALVGLQLDMRNRSVDSILDAPKMEDKRIRAGVRIMSATAIAAYFVDRTLYALFAVKQVRLSLKYGNAYTTSSAYASVALIYTAVLKKYKRGYYFGDLALRLMKKRNAKKLQARIAMIFHGIISPWQRHIGMGLEPLKKGFQQGMDSGDFEYGLHAALEYSLCGIYTGRPLDDLWQTSQRFYLAAQQVDQKDPMEVLQVECQVIENLIDEEKGGSDILEGTFLSESTELRQMIEEGSRTAIACAYALKYYLAVIFENYSIIEEYSSVLDKYIDSVVGTIGRPIMVFADSMCRIGWLQEMKSVHRKEYLKQIKKNQKEMRVWANNAPMNFEHRYYLVEAELAALEGQDGKASRLYKKAIHLAQENDYTNDEALALERFGYLCLKQENRPVAGLYLRKAYLTYQRWGAMAKLAQLREKYYDLLLPEEIPDLTERQIEMMESSGRSSTVHHSLIGTTRRLKTTSMYSSSSGGVSMLDFSSLLKASNALAQEVNLQGLQEKMLEITLENAGAQLGVFVRQSDEGLMVEASRSHEDSEQSAEGVQLNIPLSKSSDIPVSMVNYVARTKKPLVLAHASKDQTYAFDPYVKQRQCLSTMCFPVMSQGKLGGIIYLENNLMADAFTEDRLEVLNMLSAQMGIALDNAQLYNNLEKKVAERTAELNETNASLSEKNKKITDSIRYAQTIQAAMLPSNVELAEHFADHFALFRPKDIVSGDFYWCNQLDGEVFVAVADCTGHGVPGAFMSMIGISLLDEILVEKKVTSPADMLEELNKGIRAGLKQDKTDNDDGMDVCLCAIKPLGGGNFRLRYSGAKRPLYYMKENELLQLKGSNKTIGGFFKRKEGAFAEYTDELAKGDMVYLSSDGYIDQSNKKHKKIGTALLLTLLEGNSMYAMPKQQELLEKILDLHQEGVEQRDDITVLGLKL